MDELDHKLRFGFLQRELGRFKPALAQAKEKILNEEISNYPIFVFHKGEIDIGVELIEEDLAAGGWLVHASTLEEFVARQIVNGQERIDDFRETFKQHDGHYCLFVLSELGHNFIFLEQ